MWDKLTRKANEAIKQARQEATLFGQGQVAPEHLLLGILQRGDSVAAIVLEHIGVSLTGVESLLGHHHPSTPNVVAPDLQLTVASQQAIENSIDEARILHNNYIGTEHILLSLAGNRDEVGRFLRDQGANQEAVRQIISSIQQGDFRRSSTK